MMSRARMTKKRVGRETNSIMVVPLDGGKKGDKATGQREKRWGAKSLGEGVESYVVWPGWERRRGRG